MQSDWLLHVPVAQRRDEILRQAALSAEALGGCRCSVAGQERPSLDLDQRTERQLMDGDRRLSARCPRQSRIVPLRGRSGCSQWDAA